MIRQKKKKIIQCIVKDFLNICIRYTLMITGCFWEIFNTSCFYHQFFDVIATLFEINTFKSEWWCWRKEKVGIITWISLCLIGFPSSSVAFTVSTTTPVTSLSWALSSGTGWMTVSSRWSACWTITLSTWRCRYKGVVKSWTIGIGLDTGGEGVGGSWWLGVISSVSGCWTTLKINEIVYY